MMPSKRYHLHRKDFPANSKRKQRSAINTRPCQKISIAIKFPIGRFDTLSNPEWVIVEFKGLIQLKSGGEYNNRYIGLAQIKNGKIVFLREYFDRSFCKMLSA
jgi:ketosteroid isomerase-like protein